MCERCDEIATRIERYRSLATGILDKAALDSIDRLVAALEETRGFLHADELTKLASQAPHQHYPEPQQPAQQQQQQPKKDDNK
jgi:hypothetical protein